MKSYLYFIKADGTNIYKIGYSEDPKKRLKQLQTGNWNILRLVAIFQFANRQDVARYETLLHKQLKQFKVNGEWYKLTPKYFNEIIKIL